GVGRGLTVPPVAVELALLRRAVFPGCTLSLHDAPPISPCTSIRRRPRRKPPAATATTGTTAATREAEEVAATAPGAVTAPVAAGDRKSTRLNSSHVKISYAVFCLKKKTSVGRRAPAQRA